MRWRRWVASLAWFACLASTAQAPNPSAATVLNQDDVVIVAVRVNDVGKGDAFVIIESPKRVWMRETDFKKLGIQGLTLTQQKLGEVPYALLSESNEVKVAADLDALVLRLDVAPSLLGLQRVNLSAISELKPVAYAPFHGFLNYTLYADKAAKEALRLSADFNLNIAARGWVARSEWRWDPKRGDAQLPRRTFLQKDDMERHARWTIGDLVSGRGAFAESVPLRGVSYASDFALSPGVSPFPALTLNGAVSRASTAEVFIDGIRVRSIDLRAGLFELNNLRYFAGLREVEIVIRDRAGGVQRTMIPSYFSNVTLAKGIHEFQYSAGEASGVAAVTKGSQDSRGRVMSAFHRYGVDDMLTLGGTAYVDEHYRKWSASMIAAGRLGVFSLDTAQSQGASVSGTASRLGYAYAGRRTNFALALSQQSRGFGQRSNASSDALTADVLSARVLREIAVSAGAAIGDRRVVSVDVSRGVAQDGSHPSSISARASQGFANGASLQLFVSRSHQGNAASTAIGVTLSFPLGAKRSSSVSVERRPNEGVVTAARLAESAPIGAGVASQAAVERSVKGEAVEVATIANFANVGTSFAAKAARSDGSERTLAFATQVSGSVVRVLDQWHLAPRIDEAFAVVDTDGLAGIRVSQNNQEIGRTNSAGYLVVPRMAAYSSNQIRIDDRDVPMDRDLDRVAARVAPLKYQGLPVKFTAKKFSAVTGWLILAGSGPETPIKSAELLATAGGVTKTSSTGPDGDFSLDDVDDGVIELRAENRTLRCKGMLTIPAARGPIFDAGKVLCEPIRP